MQMTYEKIAIFDPMSRFISEMIRDAAIVIMARR